MQGVTTASMPGNSFGALISGFVTDIFSRKSAIQMGTIIWLVMLQRAEPKATDIMHNQDYRKHTLFRLSEHCYVNCGSIHQRLVCRDMFTWGVLIMFYGSSFLAGSVASGYLGVFR